MELLYARYNRHRLPRFQVETSIWRDGGRKFVLKKALTPDAVAHLERLHAQTAPIRHSLRGGCLRLPEVTVIDKQTLRFDFVEGRSLDALLSDAFRERDQARFLGIVGDYLALLNSAFAPLHQETARGADAPVWTEDMRQVFALTSPAELEGLGPFLTPALADLVFENIIAADGRYYLIDHEWVFDGCLPVSFILFRSLFYFYEKNKQFGLETWMPLSAALERFALAPATIRRYREMDEAFQAHVFGRERCYRYKDRYAKYAHSVPSLLETIEHQRQVVRDYHAKIRKMQASDGWRFVMKAGRLRDKYFPPGTRRRRVLERILRRLQ
jgi:O-antigen biosynthesis protein